MSAWKIVGKVVVVSFLAVFVLAMGSEQALAGNAPTPPAPTEGMFKSLPSHGAVGGKIYPKVEIRSGHMGVQPPTEAGKVYPKVENVSPGAVEGKVYPKVEIHADPTEVQPPTEAGKLYPKVEMPLPGTEGMNKALPPPTK